MCKQIHNPQEHYDINDVYYYLFMICESLMIMVPCGDQLTTSLTSNVSVLKVIRYSKNTENT